jgi:ribosomal protein S27AE/Holliday junction resolvase RusA-like endonuclease
MDPIEYRRHIRMLGIGELKKMKIRTDSDARDVLGRVLEMQQGLKEMKREVELDIRFINEQKESKKQKKSRGFSLFGKKQESQEGASGNMQNPAAFDTLKKDIDTLVAQLNRLRTQLEAYITDAQSRPQAYPEQAEPVEEPQGEPSAGDSLFDTYTFENDEIGTFSLQEESEIEQVKEKFCPYCGNILNTSDKFCGKCGKTL